MGQAQAAINSKAPKTCGTDWFSKNFTPVQPNKEAHPVKISYLGA